MYVFAKLQVKMEKKLLTEILFGCRKRILPMDVYIASQLSAENVRVRTIGGKQQHCKKRKEIRYFSINNIAECWCEISCTYESYSLINVEVHNFALLHFSKWRYFHFGSWTTCYISATCEKVGHM